MSRDKRDAERAARRAKRLAERTEERARRQERHAQRAAERAERLAERVRRRPDREKNLDKSIEDIVDEVTEKAEAWIDEQTRQLFGSGDEDREVRRAEKEAKRAREAAAKARQQADRAGKAASDLSELEASMYDDGMDAYDDDTLDDGMDSDELWMGDESPRRRRNRRSSRRYGSGRFSEHWGYDDFKMTRRRRRGWRSPHLYRDRQRKKVCGVCAGVADYFGRPAWEIRLYAVLGLFFLPSLVVPAYFIMYFLMDDKPYYRRVTDRVDEDLESYDDAEMEQQPAARSRRQERKAKRASAMKNGKPAGGEPQMNNVQAMSIAKEKFSDIEQRLRQMESHVTSSRFELQRELKKISGED